MLSKFKTRKRLLLAVNKLSSVSETSRATYRNITKWATTSAVDRTSDHTRKNICTLKIPDSFPEVTTLVFGLARKNTIIDMEEFLNYPWLASLNLGGSARMFHKAKNRLFWNKVFDGSTLNSGSAVKFDEAIYNRSMNDKIKLIKQNGNVWKDQAYDIDQLTDYFDEMFQICLLVSNPEDFEAIVEEERAMSASSS